MAGVKEILKTFVTEVQINGRDNTDVGSQITKMCQLRFKPNSPRIPPHVLIVGPPGSGRQSQAKMLADYFGLIHVSVR